jgi:hypothetical protein
MICPVGSQAPASLSAARGLAAFKGLFGVLSYYQLVILILNIAHSHIIMEFTATQHPSLIKNYTNEYKSDSKRDQNSLKQLKTH